MTLSEGVRLIVVQQRPYSFSHECVLGKWNCILRLYGVGKVFTSCEFQKTI